MHRDTDKTMPADVFKMLGKLFTGLMAAVSAVLVCTALLIAIFKWNNIRRSQVYMSLTLAEIHAEDARLTQFGLTLRDGSLLIDHPFQPPWTSHSLLMPSQSRIQPPLLRALLGSSKVRADLLRSDLDVLEPVMQRAYGGWDSASARGWNWSKWFSDWRNRLAAKGSTEITLDEAFAPVDGLKAFQRDNHTQIPLERFARVGNDGSQTALLKTIPESSCQEVQSSGKTFQIPTNDPAQQVKIVNEWHDGESTLARAAYISMPLSRGTPQAVYCGSRWIYLSKVDTKSSSISPLSRWFSKSDPPRIEKLGDGVVYVRLPTFLAANYEDLSRNNWPHRESGDRILIVDLRNNDGGSAGYGKQVLEGWIDQSRMVPWDQFGKQLIASCLYAPLRWNAQMVFSPKLFPGQKTFLQDLLDQIGRSYQAGCPRTVDVTEPRWTYSAHRFAPKPGNLRIIALVNSKCGSDCELLTAELASLPETIVAGVNTFGVGQFIQPGYSVLPHTGLHYRIALGMSNFYGDNRSYDGYGLDVDVILPDVDTLQPAQLRNLAEVIAQLPVA
jgi:hypothetical protein